MLNINIILLYNCNLSCHFCDSYILKKDTPNQLLVDQNINIVNNLKKIKEPFQITITGGEPCLHKYLDKIIYQYIHIKQLQNIVITTNAMDISILFKLRKLLYLYNSIELLCTYHPQNNKYDVLFLKNIKQLNWIKKVVKFMLCNNEKENEKSIQMFKKIKSYINIPYRIQPISKIKKDIIIKYKNFLYDTVTEYNPTQYIINDKNIFTDQKCNPSYYILPNGCFKYCDIIDSNINFIQNVYSEQLIRMFFSKTLICKKEKCWDGMTIYRMNTKRTIL